MMMISRSEEYKHVAEGIAKDLKIVIPKSTNEIMVYDEKKGIYINGENAIHRATVNMLDISSSSHGIKEVRHFILGNNDLYIDDEEVKAKYVISLLNGCFDVIQKKFFNHAPFDRNGHPFYTTVQMPIVYDEQADCPAIKQFISDVVGEENVQLVREMIGYCLLRDYPIHKAFMLVGEGQNGKSVMINMLKAFLGSDNFSSISLHQLGDGRFGAIGVKDKLANLYPDLDKRALYSTGLFKILTGNDSVTVDRKFKDLVTFKSYAKLIFSANALPMTPDISYAFFRRWVIINFPNTFKGDKCDPFIIDKITTKEELSGLFNWVVSGLHELLERKEFTTSKSVSETENEYLRLSCSTDAFVKECLVFEPSSFVSKANIYEIYATWTEKHRLLVEEQKKLTSSIMKIIPKARQAQPRKEGAKRERGWQGVAVKDGIIDIDDIEQAAEPENPQSKLNFNEDG